MRSNARLLIRTLILTLVVAQTTVADFVDDFERPGGPGPDVTVGPCTEEVLQDISGPTIWRNGPAACDYLVGVRNADDPTALGFATVSVTDGMLTIEPGTVIQFAEDASLSFADGGGLHAVGTPAARILFESSQPIPGFGRGTYFGFRSLVSRIEYVDFVNLGKEVSLGGHDAAIAAVSSSDAGLRLLNSTVSGSATIGAELEEFALLEFANNQFFSNAEFGLRVGGPQIAMLDAASDYLGAGRPNGRPYVAIEGVGSGDRVQQDATWRNLNAPYFLQIALNIDSGHINIEPGVRFIASADSAFKVSGPASLSAVGTAEQPIRFVGELASVGYWEGINFFESDSPNNRFDFVEVRHGGGDRGDANIDLDFAAFLRISNSTVSDSATVGVCVGFRSVLNEGNGNAFSNNSQGDIVVDGENGDC